MHLAVSHERNLAALCRFRPLPRFPMSSSLLCMAAKCGHLERLEILLDASALTTVVDKRGYSPLMCAAENISQVDTAILLIANGADVNFASV